MQQTAEDVSVPVGPDDRGPVEAAAAFHPIIREYHEELEREQRLPPALVQQLRDAGMYSLTIPRALGGRETPPLIFLRAVELLAEGAGSVGWNIANNGVIQLIALSLPDDGIQEIFGHGAGTIVAGTAVQGGGRAVPVDGGYRVTGRWRFGSGSQEAAWMLGSFEILDGDQPRRNPDGSILYWRGFFRREECTTIPGTWDVTGVRATGSFDWTVTDQFIPDRRTVIHAGAPLENQWSKWPGTTYALPVETWIGPHHSAVATGIARAGVDALKDLVGSKVPRGRSTDQLVREQPQIQDWVGRAEALLEAGRAYRTAVLTELWDTVESGAPTTLDQRARCRLASTHAADCGRQALDLMHRAGGSTSFQRTHRLAECWRDLSVVSQAVTVLHEWYPLAGRVFLGLDPGPRLR